MIRAYSKLYLDDAQINLARMFDYALRGLHYDSDVFFSLFIKSGIAEMFECGNPKYVCGLSGFELVQKVLEKTGHNYKTVSLDYSFDGPEYWLGWVMSYYQWYTGLRFSDLQQYGLVPSEILKRYILHEADISKFVETATSIIRANKEKSPTRLKIMRQKRNMTQKQLSEESGVSLRMIQLYEQRQNDINKAAGIVINKLAWVLKCNFYEIMEIDLEE